MKPIETCPTCDGIGVRDIKLKGTTLPVLIKGHNLLQKGCISGQKNKFFIFSANFHIKFMLISRSTIGLEVRNDKVNLIVA